jgi:hypothetical protein
MTAPTPAQTQREHDPADDLVTEEVIIQAASVFTNRVSRTHTVVESIEAALRAVAPMIWQQAYRSAHDEILRAVAAERERCAKIAEKLPHLHSYTSDRLTYGQEVADAVAAAIRARGETT